MNNLENDTNNTAEEDNLQSKITKLQKVKQLQVQAIQMQSKIFLQQNQEYPLHNHTLATSALSIDITVRKMKVQDGYYNISLWKYRTYCKDC